MLCAKNTMREPNRDRIEPFCEWRKGVGDGLIELKHWMETVQMGNTNSQREKRVSTISSKCLSVLTRKVSFDLYN